MRCRRRRGSCRPGRARRHRTRSPRVLRWSPSGPSGGPRSDVCVPGGVNARRRRPRGRGRRCAGTSGAGRRAEVRQAGDAGAGVGGPGGDPVVRRPARRARPARPRRRASPGAPGASTPRSSPPAARQPPRVWAANAAADGQSAAAGVVEGGGADRRPRRRAGSPGCRSRRPARRRPRPSSANGFIAERPLGAEPLRRTCRRVAAPERVERRLDARRDARGRASARDQRRRRCISTCSRRCRGGPDGGDPDAARRRPLAGPAGPRRAAASPITWKPACSPAAVQATTWSRDLRRRSR